MTPRDNRSEVGRISDVEISSAGAVDIAWQAFGSPADTPVVLGMGLATQMLAWPDGFCARLAERGHYVVRFDNRDVGLSTHLHDAPAPDPAAAFAGDVSTASYTLSDMANDTAGLIEALGLDSAHVVGMSMGGMIAQTLAIEQPARVRSLTSIMSTTGDRAVGFPTEAGLGVLMAPRAGTREEAQERLVQTFRVIASPVHGFDEAALRERAGIAFDRAHDPAGVARQLVAIIASGDRTPRLREIDVPALVIHGAADPMVDLSGARATADAIAGAELVVFEDMGHDLPEPLFAEIVERIAAHVARAERAREGRPA